VSEMFALALYERWTQGRDKVDGVDQTPELLSFSAAASPPSRTSNSFPGLGSACVSRAGLRVSRKRTLSSVVGIADFVCSH
jgi:hypothetical protein